jgi:hypothetical protein
MEKDLPTAIVAGEQACYTLLAFIRIKMEGNRVLKPSIKSTIRFVDLNFHFATRPVKNYGLQRFGSLFTGFAFNRGTSMFAVEAWWVDLGV